MTPGNLTAKEFQTRLHDGFKSEIKCNDDAAYAYDAVWVLAYSHKTYVNAPSFMPYETIESIKTFFGSIFQEQIRFAIDFEGLTGPLKYYHEVQENRYHRIGSTSIWSNHGNNKPMYVGTYDAESKGLSLIKKYKTALFKNGIIPKDKAVFEKFLATFSKTIVYYNVDNSMYWCCDWNHTNVCLCLGNKRQSQT